MDNLEGSNDNGLHMPPSRPLGLIGVAYGAGIFLGLGIHLFTIAVAYATCGFFGAVATFCFPVLAQVFWFIVLWYYHGTPFTFYGIAVIGYTALSFTLIMCAGARSDSKSEPNEN